MATKSDALFLYEKCGIDNGSQFTNLNLNQNHQNPEPSSIHSYNKTKTFKKDYGHDLPVVNNNYKSSKSFERPKKDSWLEPMYDFNSYNNKDKEELKKRWKNESSSNTKITSSSSTLSLHIDAYENGIEAEASNKKDSSSKNIFEAKTISSKLQNCFEYPRQMNSSESGTPEVMQFKASQKLVTPNQASTPVTPASATSSLSSIGTAKLPSPLGAAAQGGSSGGGGAAAAGSEGEKKHYKKDPSQRIFVGRSLRLEKIKFYGFDMDYTLANYKSPQYETLLFERTIERLIQVGYPEDLKQFTYDPNFPVRGLWFDSQYGNLLKVDGFGNILLGVHGTKNMKPHEIEEYYPNKFLKLVDNRVHVLNTLFNLPDTYVFAKLVDYYDNLPGYKKTSDKTGVKSGEAVMSYKSITQDVVGAVNWVHISGGMKDYILQNIDKYIHKADELRNMMLQLRSAGAKTFLLTNSEYKYTHGVMTYLAGPDWPQLFDIAIVDAKKPAWFSESSVFRQVDTTTGTLKVGMHAGQLKRGNVYAGGSCDGLKRLMKFRGKDVLYVGDHIFGDVLRSKKSRGWRTFLVVPELTHELTVWTERHQLFEQLETFDATLGKIYKNLDFRSTNNDQQRTSIDEAVKAIRKVTHDMNQAYGLLGSLFRSGTRTTFFATQVERYADIYSSSTYNLIHYPKFYFFRAPMMLLPHESTVDHLAKINDKRKKPEQQPSGGQPSICHEDTEDDGALEDKNPPSENKQEDSDVNDNNSSKDYAKKGDSKN